MKQKKQMTTYYKYIDGKRYDRALLDLADKLVKNTRDGRISIDDAITLFNSLSDSSKVTETEKNTLKYILDNYKLVINHC